MRSDRKHITAVLEEDKEAREFIHGGKRSALQPPSHLATQPPIMRRKISIRIPPEIDDLLSQVSHERIRAYRQTQLFADQPREKQEIVVEALRNWFEKHGYMK
jgi:hypothetical protein